MIIIVMMVCLLNVWGPSLWHTLHTISFNYPKRPTSSEKKEL